MAEESPFPEENKLEDDVDEELLLILATAFLKTSQEIKPKSFSRADFQALQDSFKANASEAIPFLEGINGESVKLAYKRLPKGVEGSGVDISEPRFRRLVENIWNDNLDYVLGTNEQFWNELQQIAADKGWSDEVLAKNLKRFYGLTPNHLKTVLSMEDALRAEDVSAKTVKERVEKRVDDLVEWRIRLTSTLVGTEVVEGAKELTFTILGETGKLDPEIHIKQWVSVADNRTTQVCLGAHLTTAEIGGVFEATGTKHPPALYPLHECRSSMRIIKRK